NGMQTLGVALPWAIAATLVEPGKKVAAIAQGSATPNDYVRNYQNKQKFQIVLQKVLRIHFK
ncbi:hypothetical protein ACT453_43435, partial [Bacillus sp. D-CC]